MSAEGKQLALVPRCVVDSDAWRALDATAMRVYLAIALHANQEGRAWPGVELLGTIAGSRRRNTQRAIGRLRDAGFIDVEVGGGRHRSSRYTIRNSVTPRHPLSGETAARQDTVSYETAAQGDALSVEKRRRCEAETAAQEGTNSGAGRSETAARCAARTPKEQQRNNKPPPNPVGGGELNQVIDFLRRHGVRSEAKLRAIAATPGITVEACKAVLRKLPSDAGGGLVVTALETNLDEAISKEDRENGGREFALMSADREREIYQRCVEAGDFADGTPMASVRDTFIKRRWRRETPGADQNVPRHRALKAASEFPESDAEMPEFRPPQR